MMCNWTTSFHMTLVSIIHMNESLWNQFHSERKGLLPTCRPQAIPQWIPRHTTRKYMCNWKEISITRQFYSVVNLAPRKKRNEMYEILFVKFWSIKCLFYWENCMYYCHIFLIIYFGIKVKVHFSHQSLCSGGKNGLKLWFQNK